MDPIHPITPGPPPVQRPTVPPVKRLERVSRERDRPAQERDQARERRQGYTEKARPGDDEQDGRPRIDVVV